MDFCQKCQKKLTLSGKWVLYYKGISHESLIHVVMETGRCTNESFTFGKFVHSTEMNR